MGASAGGVDIFIQGKGPVLNLEPLFDRLFVTSPDKGAEEQNMIGGIVLPGNTTMTSYAVVDVIAVGPDVKGIVKGDKVMLVRAQVDRVNHDGNDYWRTSAPGVIGVVR